MKNLSIKTVEDVEFTITNDDKIFNYQSELTPTLDSLTEDFNQDIINQIVLWKVNRYAQLKSSTLELLNEMPKEFDVDYTVNILNELLNTSGLQLPMASTILRFKNPEIYQIIDQRVYRIIYGSTFKIQSYKSEKNRKEQIEIYCKYLKDLRVVCSENDIPFELSDRLLYNADKRLNKLIKLKNY